MSLVKKYYKLCSPARLYVVLAIVGLLITIFQNFSQPNTYRLGNNAVYLGHHNALEIIFNICFVIIWTWVLNKFCHLGWSPLSWVLVLAPFASMLLFFYLVILTKSIHNVKKN